jgi:hypothetical protein
MHYLMSFVIFLILIQLSLNLKVTVNAQLKRNMQALKVGIGLNILAAVTMPFLFGYLIYTVSSLGFLPRHAPDIWDSPLTLRTLSIFALTAFLPYLYFKYVCLSFIRDLSFHYQNRKRSLAQQSSKAAPKSNRAPQPHTKAKEKQRGASFPQSRRPAQRRR